MALQQKAEQGLEPRGAGWQLFLLCSTVCPLSWLMWEILSHPTACPLQNCPQEWPWILLPSDPGVFMCWFSMCPLKGMCSPGSHSIHMDIDMNYGSCYIWTLRIIVKFSDCLPLTPLCMWFQLGWNSWKNRSPAMEWKTALGGHLGWVQKLFYWEWKAWEVKLSLGGQCHGALAKSLHFLGQIEQNLKPWSQWKESL